MSEATANWEARSVLEAVDRWAAGCWMLRELELIGEAASKGSVSLGRLDALLVPFDPFNVPWRGAIPGWCWENAKLVGVEVKVTRADFKRGLDEGQFDRYLGGVGGMFIATPRGLVKTSEIPPHIGHLVALERWRDKPAVCKRRPKFTETQPSPAMIWKLMSLMRADFIERELIYRKAMADGMAKAGKKLAAVIAESASQQAAQATLFPAPPTTQQSTKSLLEAGEK